MDAVKEVKKILAQYTLDVRDEEFDIRAQEAAERICQLFKPPVKGELQVNEELRQLIERHLRDYATDMRESKIALSSSSRAREILERVVSVIDAYWQEVAKFAVLSREATITQIKDEECKQRVEKILKGIEELYPEIIDYQWQAFKKQEEK